MSLANYGVVRGLIPTHAGKTRFRSCVRSSRPAHPRSRWENLWGAGKSLIQGGSSPLMRGKRFQHLQVDAADGLIPAHAGKTKRAGLRGTLARAHPRSHGENEKPRRLPRMRVGSSPLTRGKLVHLVGELRGGRLIPADAGKTHPESRRPTGSRAHPRSRGENGEITHCPVSLMGSSPLMRGKHRPQARQFQRGGLIPAHAGKTRRSAREWPRCAAHPRSCGENTS